MFPGYARFFGTMQAKYWDLLAVLNELSPLRIEFWRNSQREKPIEDSRVVNSWLFAGWLDGLVTYEEYCFLCGMIGTR
jgi:hypothetical protein